MSIDVSSQKVCGRDYHVESKANGVKGRIIVSGVMHPAGKLPIRFKSLERAERHLTNMKLGK